MTTPPLFARLFLVLSLLPAVAAVVRATVPDDLVQPEYRLDPGALSPEWRAIVEPMRAHGSIQAGFIESRTLPFRRDPLELSGELRFDPARGLSLHYLPPEDTRILIDDRGILMRDTRGRSRTAPADAHAQAATAALLHVMRFDLPALEMHFAIYGAHAKNGWRLWFEPTPTASRAGLNRIIVEGSGAAVSTIHLRRSARHQIAINVGVAETAVEFSAEELARFFR